LTCHTTRQQNRLPSGWKVR
jgi:hypothetical protein